LSHDHCGPTAVHKDNHAAPLNATEHFTVNGVQRPYVTEYQMSSRSQGRKLVTASTLADALAAYSTRMPPPATRLPVTLSKVYAAAGQWDTQGSTKAAVVTLLNGIRAGDFSPPLDERVHEEFAPPVLTALLYHLGCSGFSDSSLVRDVDGATVPKPDADTSMACSAVLRRWVGGEVLTESGKAAVWEGAPALAAACSMPSSSGELQGKHPTLRAAPPASLVPLLKAVLELRQRVVDVPIAESASQLCALSPTALAKDDEISCCPHHPPVAGRAVCVRAGEDASARVTGPAGEADKRKCDNTTKTAAPILGRGQNKRSAGLMLYVCQHGVPYGWVLMKRGESPADVFKLLLTRFPPGKMPKLVVYDNGCKVEEYSLNREPWMCNIIKFIVDNFHYGGNRGSDPIHKCPDAFDSKRYSSMNGVNTSIAEHTNSLLCFFKDSARCMGPANIISVVTLHFFYIAEKKNKMMQEQPGLLKKLKEKYIRMMAKLGVLQEPNEGEGDTL